MDRLFQGLAVANVLNAAGLKVFPVAQTFTGLGPLWREFERLMLAGKVHHGGHPILRLVNPATRSHNRFGWQPKTDAREPDRQDRPGDGETFALDRHARTEVAPAPQRSIYEDRELFTL